MRLENPLWTHAEQFEALQNTNQGIDILIPKIKLGVDVRSHGSSLSVLHSPRLRDERRTSALRRVFVFRLYGGDFATGSGGMRAGNCGRVESCAPNGK